MSTKISEELKAFYDAATQCIFAMEAYNSREEIASAKLSEFKNKLVLWVIVSKLRWDRLEDKPKVPRVIASLWCELERAQERAPNILDKNQATKNVAKHFHIHEADTKSEVETSAYELCTRKRFAVNESLDNGWDDLLATDSEEDELDESKSDGSGSDKSASGDDKKRKQAGKRPQTTLTALHSRADQIKNEEVETKLSSQSRRSNSHAGSMEMVDKKFRVETDREMRKAYASIVLVDEDVASPYTCSQCKAADRKCYVNTKRSAKCVACSSSNSLQCSIAPRWHGHIMAMRSGGGYTLQHWLNTYNSKGLRKSGAGNIEDNEHDRAHARHLQAVKAVDDSDDEPTSIVKRKAASKVKREDSSTDEDLPAAKRPRRKQKSVEVIELDSDAGPSTSTNTRAPTSDGDDSDAKKFVTRGDFLRVENDIREIKVAMQELTRARR